MSSIVSSSEGTTKLKKLLYKFIVKISHTKISLDDKEVRLYDCVQPFKSSSGIQLIPMKDILRELCIALYVISQSDLDIMEYLKFRKQKLQDFDIFYFIMQENKEKMKTYLGVNDFKTQNPFTNKNCLFYMLEGPLSQKENEFLETLPTIPDDKKIFFDFLESIAHENKFDFQELRREAIGFIVSVRQKTTQVEKMSLSVPGAGTRERALFENLLKWLNIVAGIGSFSDKPNLVIPVMDVNILVRTKDNNLQFMPVKETAGQVRVALALLCIETHKFSVDDVIDEVGFDSQGFTANFVKILSLSREDMLKYDEEVVSGKGLKQQKTACLRYHLNHESKKYQFLPITTLLDDEAKFINEFPLQQFLEKFISEFGEKLHVNVDRALLNHEARCCAPECQKAPNYFCDGCQKVVYCSKSCQKEAWRKGHKEECRKASETQLKNGAVESASEWIFPTAAQKGGGARASEARRAEGGGGGNLGGGFTKTFYMSIIS
jgi:hypothetical protein